MEYCWLGKGGLQVSELCLGTMTFGEEAGEATARTIIDRFLDAGGNFVFFKLNNSWSSVTILTTIARREVLSILIRLTERSNLVSYQMEKSG